MTTREVLVALGLLAVGGCGGSAVSSVPSEVHIDVTNAGFVPASKVVQSGRPLTLIFTRKTDKTCATDVVFTKLHRGYDLPLNKPVRVALESDEVRDTINFTCSMNMLHGMLVAK